MRIEVLQSDVVPKIGGIVDGLVVVVHQSGLSAVLRRPSMATGDSVAGLLGTQRELREIRNVVNQDWSHRGGIRHSSYGMDIRRERSCL